MANPKTNAMRILDRAGVSYQTHTYTSKDGAIDGISVANKIGQPPERVFKTLVAQASSRAYCVFVIPVAKELDLKAAAKSVGEKSVALIKPADLIKVTGYIRGGCSPVGMKKAYATVIDSSAGGQSIIVSAGKIGMQVEVMLDDLKKVTAFKTARIVQ